MNVTSQCVATENAARHHAAPDLKAEGVHYTPANLATFVAKAIVAEWEQKSANKADVSVVDPACGDGELLLALLRELHAKGFTRVSVHGFETNASSAREANRRISEAFPNDFVKLRQCDFLEHVAETGYWMPTLFGEEGESFDLLIANPPYVRTQVMGSRQAQALADQFGLRGRVDLYHAFLTTMSRILKPGGVAGVIVSNRFMTTKSGAAVRGGLLDHFLVSQVWDLGDTRLFNAAVLPAVLLLERKNEMTRSGGSGRFTSVYTTKLEGSFRRVEDVLEAVSEAGLVETGSGERFLVEVGLLDNGNSREDVWRMSSDDREAWMRSVEANTALTFGELGDVRVGVKTTADKVFILKDWRGIAEEDRPELIRPLMTHHSARRFKPLEPKVERGIVYPHEVQNGRRVAVDLSRYPKTARYLAAHREVLEARSYVSASGRQWYEVWVPQDPEAWRFPKLVFRDITEQPMFWADTNGCVVNGDCYWLSCRDHGLDELLWLAMAIGNSSFIEAFYDRRYNNKLYAGRRRFMTQYVKEFPLPDPGREISRRIMSLSKRVFEATPSLEGEELSAELDDLVWESFGLSVEKVVR